MRVLEDGNFFSKLVLVRIDADLPISSSGEIDDDMRLRVLLPTLNFLLNRKAKLVLMAHLGRPAGGAHSGLSLRPVYLHLSALLKRPIRFAPSLFSPKTALAVKSLREGEILALENLRFDKGELGASRTLAKKLSQYGECFVNESFASAHREAASTSGVCEFLPSYAGLRFEQEVETLGNLIKSAASPFIIIIGGAKVGDKLPVIRNLIDKADRILAGGRVANNFLSANGYDIKQSVVEPNLLDEAKELIKRSRGKIVLPTDFVWNEEIIFDLGKQTVDDYKRYLRGAKTVVWAGPLGKYETPKYELASKELAQFVVKTDATTIAGGGETLSMLRHFGLTDKFSFISTGGGAMLELLAGHSLPAIRALEN